MKCPHLPYRITFVHDLLQLKKKSVENYSHAKIVVYFFICLRICDTNLLTSYSNIMDDAESKLDDFSTEDTQEFDENESELNI